MKILVAIPHYYRAVANSRYGSHGPDREPRRRALAACIGSLRRLFGQEQYATDLTAFCAGDRGTVAPAATAPANRATSGQLTILVVTVDAAHVLDDLAAWSPAYSHEAVACPPALLGFECQRMLGARLGDYDYYGYLEDDLVLHDPWFFAKLSDFARQFGPDTLLQPNRYELTGTGLTTKAYIDGQLPDGLSAPFQDLSDRPEVVLSAAGREVCCQRTTNPHSGCYFLSQPQLERWTAQAHFGDRDCRFIGPLESAATLGIMRTFRVYKPAMTVANYLELQHFGDAWIRRIALRGGAGRAIGDALAPRPPVECKPAEQEGPGRERR